MCGTTSLFAMKTMRGQSGAIVIAALIGSAFLLLAACTGTAATGSASSPTTPAASRAPTSPVPASAIPTPPRTSRVPWGTPTASVADITARFRAAGLSVEAKAPPSTVVFGAQSVDLFTVQGQATAVYSFANVDQSARVLDDATNGRLTVSYLQTPYFVQVANLLIVVTTDDATAAATLLGALARA